MPLLQQWCAFDIRSRNRTSVWLERLEFSGFTPGLLRSLAPFPCSPSSTPSNLQTVTHLTLLFNALFYILLHRDTRLRPRRPIQLFAFVTSGSYPAPLQAFSPAINRVFLMPVATAPFAVPRPAALVKMDDRKRPAASAVDDLAPPSKRVNLNGAGKSRDDSGDKNEDAWIEVSHVTRRLPLRHHHVAMPTLHIPQSPRRFLYLRRFTSCTMFQTIGCRECNVCFALAVDMLLPACSSIIANAQLAGGSLCPLRVRLGSLFTLNLPASSDPEIPPRLRRYLYKTPIMGFKCDT